MKRKAMVVMSLLSIVSCRQNTGLTDAQKATIIAEVRQTLNNYYTDIGKSGLTAEFDYLDNSSEFFWVPPGYPGAISYDSVASILRHDAPLYKSIQNSFDTLHIIALDKQHAIYTGRLNSTVTDTTGNARTFVLVETGLVVKRKEGWKLLSGQTSMLSK
jgi:hypothetical protein